jgi:hypothetical protein
MKLILSIVALTLATGTAFAQSDTATLVGRVTDSTTAVVPGATVEVRDVATDAHRTVVTNKQGEYTVPELTPDTYDVTITKAGFEKTVEPSIVLTTDQTARFDVTLVVGSVEQTVTVTTEVGALNTETSDKGDTISPVEISEMPLDGRDFNDLVFNVAGVSTAEEGGKGSEFVANGVRSDQTNVQVDGINNTNPRDSTAEAAPPLDALQEFKVQTSNYSAEFGRVAGPVINLSIKKGGNVLHGSLFEFVRNDLFDAGNYFDVPGTHSELRRNQFGGTMGGPVYIPHLYNGHDKTFFLLSAESYRQVSGSNDIGIVPTLLERAGDFSQSFNTFTGVAFNTPVPPTTPGGQPTAPLPIYNPNTGSLLLPNPNAKSNYYPNGYPSVLPASAFDPIAVKLMNQFYPLPTTGVTLPSGNNYIVNEKAYSYWDNAVVKIDQQLAAHDEASIKYLFRHEHTTKPFSGSDTGQWGSVLHNLQTIVAFNETHIFTPNLINDFRSGLTRNVNNEHPFDMGIPWGALLGINGGTTNPALEDFPYFNVNGYETLGDSTQQPIQYTSNNYDTNDSLTWSHGKHTVKFGGDMLKVQYFQPTNSEFSGSIGFSGRATQGKPVTSSTAQNGFLEFLSGYTSTVDLRLGNTVNHLFDTSYAAFAQDDYKVLPGLTLNLGVRYELESLPYEENGQLSNYIPSLQKVVLAANETPALDLTLSQVSGATANIVYASQIGYPKTLVHPNYNRVAPRVGFALRPSLNDQLVIRGGYGIFYTGSRLTVIRTELAGQFPFSLVLSCGSGTIETSLPDCNGKNPKFSTVNGYDPNAPSSYVQSYNLTVERELPKGMAMELGYTGSKGTHIGWQVDINQANPYYTLSQYGSYTMPGCVTSSTSLCYARPNSNFSTIKQFVFNAYSNYNAATATLRKRFEHGLLFRLNFTYAKAIDLNSGLNYAGNGGYQGVQDTDHQNLMYARSDSDRKFVLNGNFVYMVPFHRNIFVSGWESAGSVQVDSGLPLTPQLNSPNSDTGFATLPNRVCNGALAHPSVNEWFNTACFPQATQTYPNFFGNSGRNIITGPKLVVISLSLSRNFRVTEKTKVQFRGEMFNVPNHPNFSTPNDALDQANVGSITSAKDPRVIQIGGKYQF